MNGIEYHLSANEGNNHLHGGTNGLNRRIFQAEIQEEKLIFRYHSPDGEGGYPGALDITISYTHTEEDELMITYEAHADRPTYFAPTSHSYFNLNGHDKGLINRHRLCIAADNYTPVNSENIPTGKIKLIIGTKYDFSTMKEIGNIPIDINYSLKMNENHAATLISEDNEVRMDVYTTFPGLQVYTSDYLSAQGKNGYTYMPRSGICLETQYLPNAVNIEHFQIPVVSVDSPFNQKTVYAFS